MSQNVCKICDGQFKEDKMFHCHLRSHKFTQSEYYQKFFPRFDKHDGSLIKFKNKEYYFTAEFNSRNTLKQWLESVTPETARNYIESFLIHRKETKGLVYAPTQVELRTLALPGRIYIEKKFGDYNQFCIKLGFKIRFPQQVLDISLFSDISKKVIFADSREQMPLEFNNTTRTKGMKFGDYRIANCNIYIERKSIGDIWGTLSGGFERFEREIIRAKEANAYLIILVESLFTNLALFPSQKQVYGKIKLPVQFIEHNIRALLQKYQHIQFLFCKNREDASRLVEKIFAAGEQVKNTDLQFLYDVGTL